MDNKIKTLLNSIFVLLLLASVSDAERLSADGTHFEMNNSEYLNIKLDSSEPIELVLESAPEMVTMSFKSASTYTSTQIILGGFAPMTTYHKYEDNYHNHTIFVTDSSGNYSYIQDISQQHFVFIQPRPSTRFIRDDVTGGDCASIGTWDSGFRTCTLTMDLSETIQIDSDGITLDGNQHVLTGSNTGYGVYSSGKSGVTIKNINSRNFSYGIYLHSSANSTLNGNSANSNGYKGIVMYQSGNSTLSGNVANSNRNQGIELYYSDNSILDNNIVNANLYQGILLDSSSKSILNSNIVNSNNREGIKLILSGGSTLSSNTVSSNKYEGIRLDSSVNSILINNTAKSNRYQGIELNYSGNSILNNNTAHSNRYQGIELYSSGNSILNNNDVFSNRYQGIRLNFSDSSTLSGNTAKSNTYEGISLLNSYNNELSGNNVSYNSNGISLSYSNDNLIYHNNLFNNTEYNASDTGINQWDSGSEGNYYSDYTGIDADNNGIGDIPYPVPGGSSVDRYPLMAQYVEQPASNLMPDLSLTLEDIFFEKVV